ncbi:MAG: fatty acid desaturase family protein [Pseudomonadota bacterium]
MKPSDYLSREEISALTARSDARAWVLLLGNWAAIIAIFALAAAFPHPLVILLALPLLAGRQLGLAVLMHDAGHGTLFRSARLNALLGQYACALPIFNDQPSYARGHLEHHRKAGTAEDPDLPNYQAYPIGQASFRRKMWRDLSGQTGLKLLAYVARGAAGIMDTGQSPGRCVFVQQIAAQALILAACALSGHAWLYLLWLGAFMTVFMAIIRIRQVAEHAAVPDLYNPDTRWNTRTVDAPWWQKMLFAPNGVNYHLEHHFMASVPCYRLAALRRLLLERGALEGVPRFNGYGQLLRHAINAQ